MWIYFVIGFLSAFFLYLHNKNKKEKIFILISFTLLLLLASLRYGIGFDYLYTYVPKFYQVSNGIYDWDIGTIFICKLVQLFTHDYVYFFAICSFLTLFFIYKAIAELSDNSPFCLLLFVISGEYIMSFNAVRQYIALALFVYSIKFIIKKDFKRYFILILLATLMHESAIFLLPLYFLNKIEANKTTHFLLFVISIISIPLISKLFISIINLTKYSYYLSSSLNKFDPSYSELIVFSIVYITSIIFYNKCKNDRIYKILLNFELISLILAIVSFKIILAYRILLYFRFIQILMITRIQKNIIKSKNKVLFSLFFICLYSGLTLIGGYVLHWYDTSYKSIFGVNRIRR